MLCATQQTLCSQMFDEAEGLIWCEEPAPEGESADNRPVLIYLPGVHGDWTPMWNLGPLLAQHFRLIKTAYPRHADWSIERHAEALAELYEHLGVERAHLLAESFGSLVAWSFGLTHPARVASLVLAGGFTGPPSVLGARLARLVFTCTPAALLDRCNAAYVHSLTLRYEGELAEELRRTAFVATRTRGGFLSLANRMRLIHSTSFRAKLGQVHFPVGYLGGRRDYVVPVHREIRILQRALDRDCRFEYELFKGAPHPILPARPRGCSDWLARWIEKTA